MTQHVFDSLSDAITYIFKQEQTSLLSLDRICEVLNNPEFSINSKSHGFIPCSSISRRRISSTLSGSELFVLAGPPRTCLWAIRPHNPLFISDGAIAASIEQMLLANGPLTIHQFVEKTELSGAHLPLFDRFLTEHQNEFVKHNNETWWFSQQCLPIQEDFDNLCHAITTAFNAFPNGACVEDIHRYLCLSTVGGKRIARRSISRELSRRQDLFIHLSRAKYGLMTKISAPQAPHSLPSPSFFSHSFPIPNLNQYEPQTRPEEPTNNDIPIDDPFIKPKTPEDDDFDPFSFFGGGFQFDL